MPTTAEEQPPPPPTLPHGKKFFHQLINDSSRHYTELLPTYDSANSKAKLKWQCVYPREVLPEKRNFFWFFLVMLVVEVWIITVLIQSEHIKMEEEELRSGTPEMDSNLVGVPELRDVLINMKPKQEPEVKILKRTVLS